MARFMLAHLQNGRLDGAQILRPETIELMHARQRGKSPDMNAMCLGFYEETRNGHRVISHGGDTQWFHSDLHLMPDAGLGFFVSYNSAGKGEISGRTLLWESFLDRYFPYAPPAASAPSSAASDIPLVTGSYLSSRRSDTTFLRLIYLFSQLNVTRAEGNTIEIGDLKNFNGKPYRFEPVGSMAFREVHGQGRVVFVKDAAGRLELVTPYPFFVFTRTSGGLARSALMTFGIATLGILVLALLLWPIGGWIRRHYDRRLALPAAERRLRLWTRLAVALDVALIVLYAWAVISGLENIDLLSDKLDPWLHLMQVLRVPVDRRRGRGAGELRAGLGERRAGDLEQARRDADCARLCGNRLVRPDRQALPRRARLTDAQTARGGRASPRRAGGRSGRREGRRRIVRSRRPGEERSATGREAPAGAPTSESGGPDRGGRRPLEGFRTHGRGRLGSRRRTRLHQHALLVGGHSHRGRALPERDPAGRHDRDLRRGLVHGPVERGSEEAGQRAAERHQVRHRVDDRWRST
jgi:hypothetical protein